MKLPLIQDNKGLTDEQAHSIVQHNVQKCSNCKHFDVCIAKADVREKIKNDCNKYEDELKEDAKSIGNPIERNDYQKKIPKLVDDYYKREQLKIDTPCEYEIQEVKSIVSMFADDKSYDLQDPAQALIIKNILTTALIILRHSKIFERLGLSTMRNKYDKEGYIVGRQEVMSPGIRTNIEYMKLMSEQTAKLHEMVKGIKNVNLNINHDVLSVEELFGEQQ